ncbi:MAG: GNAT family N-acetyltransferase [Verrucomicrobiaceae bacterium]|nr:GNAT family N-acetyltransferase [Verrucomicrobiaceae bacterium]
MTNEVPLISGKKDTQLAPEELARWVATSVFAVVVCVGELPIGFGSLSISEAPLVNGDVEICHLIVHPNWRRQYKGSSLVLELTRIAKSKGFKRVVGRVAPHNAIGRAILSSLRWEKLPTTEVPEVSSCEWFSKVL